MKKTKSTKQYVPRPLSTISAKLAKAIGPIVEELTNERRATPAELVKIASDPDSPAHEFFEWDDAIAGDKYRITQAREYMRSIAIVVEENTPPPRAFYPIIHHQGEHTYEKIGVISHDVDLMEQLLVRSRSALLSWHREYRVLREMAGVGPIINAIEQEPSLREELERAKLLREQTVARVNKQVRKRA